jgi:hypothetical protein
LPASVLINWILKQPATGAAAWIAAHAAMTVASRSVSARTVMPFLMPTLTGTIAQSAGPIRHHREKQDTHGIRRWKWAIALSSEGRISRVDYDQTREGLAAFEREGIDYATWSVQI